MTIRKELSKITGYTFTSNKFTKEFETLAKEGRITMKQVLQMLAVLCEREAQREDNL